MDNLNNKKEEKIQTALGVSGGLNQDRESEVNERAQSFKRGGRKGAAQSAQGLASDASASEVENHRLTITTPAEQALGSAVERINEGFQGGKVNRNQVAIWALIRFNEKLDTDEIREIRAEYLDEFSALDAILRRAKDSGKLPPELKAYLQKQMGFEDASKKKAKKNLHENIINDDMKKSA